MIMVNLWVKDADYRRVQISAECRGKEFSLKEDADMLLLSRLNDFYFP